MELEMDDAYHEAAGKMLEEREVFWTSFIDKWKDMSGAEKQPPIELPDSAFASSNSSFRNLRSAKNSAIRAMNLQSKNEISNQKAQQTLNVGRNKQSNIKKGVIKRKSKESANIEKLDPLDSTITIALPAANLQKKNKISNQKAQRTSNTGENKPPNIKKGVIKRKSNKTLPVCSKETANVEKLDKLDSKHHNKRPRVSDDEEVTFLVEVPIPKKPKFMKTDRGLVRRFFVY